MIVAADTRRRFAVPPRLRWLLVFFSAAAPGRFFTVSVTTQIATNAAIYLVLGVGMTFIVIVAGIDLSVGPVLLLSAVLSARQRLPTPPDKHD